MSRHIVQLPTHLASEIKDYLTATIAETGTVTRDGSIVELDQGAKDTLAALPVDADGHIDAGGNLWIGCTDYQVGTL
jgi:hypothetical protein